MFDVTKIQNSADVEAQAQQDAIRQAKDSIDRAAGEARKRYVSQGDLVAEEYRIALEDAESWDGSGNAPDSIAAWANASGMTEADAQADILATSLAWRTALEAIRSIRLNGKAAVDAAELGQEQSTADTFIGQLNSI